MQGRSQQFPQEPTGIAHQMNDLIELNRMIAQHWVGHLDREQEAYVSHLAACLGLFTPSAAELVEILMRTTRNEPDAVRVARLNRMYLHFARLAAKDVAAGRLEMLIKLGIRLDQAEVLGNLTDEEVARLALVWHGPIVRFPIQRFKHAAKLHAGAAQYHAAAFVATHSPKHG